MLSCKFQYTSLFCLSISGIKLSHSFGLVFILSFDYDCPKFLNFFTFLKDSFIPSPSMTSTICLTQASGSVESGRVIHVSVLRSALYLGPAVVAAYSLFLSKHQFFSLILLASSHSSFLFPLVFFLPYFLQFLSKFSPLYTIPRPSHEGLNVFLLYSLFFLAVSRFLSFPLTF